MLLSYLRSALMLYGIGALELLQRQQAQRVTHDHGQAARAIKPAQIALHASDSHGEGRHTQIRFSFTAACGEPKQIGISLDRLNAIGLAHSPYEGPVDLALGRVAAAVGDQDLARKHLGAALATCEALHALPLQAVTLAELASKPLEELIWDQLTEPRTKK